MEEEFRKRLEATFHEEASGHLHQLGSGLIAWEKAADAGPSAFPDGLYRAAHSLKGASRAVGYAEMESVCQALEGVLAAARAGRLAATTAVFDALNAARGLLERMLSARRRMAAALPVDASLLQVLRDLENGAAPGGGAPASGAAAPASGPRPAAPPSVPPAPPEPLRAAARTPAAAPAARREEGGFVRFSLDQLGQFEIYADDLATLRLQGARLGQRLEEIRLALEDRAIPDAVFPKRMGELREMAGQAHSLNRRLQEDLEQVAARLRESVRDAMQVPVRQVLEVFPRLARDLATETGKRVDLAYSGEDTRVEKPIAEDLRDILLHLVRNAIDHGIELPEERKRLGKPPQGNIRMDFSLVPGGRVRAVIRDDGRGLDPERLRAAGRKEGLIPDGGGDWGEDRVLQLAFAPGLSTRASVTPLSGRGMGLSIVRERVEAWGGEARVEAAPGGGAVFILSFPARRAAVRGLVFSLGERKFALSTAKVRRAVAYRPQGPGAGERWPAVQEGGEWLEVSPLARALGLPESARPAKSGAVLILESQPPRAVFVDAVLGEQELVVKPLGPSARAEAVAGAALLATGETALVLDLQAARGAYRAGPFPDRETEAERPARVLVAEDSITSRTLIKSLLETAGYAVSIAVDGAAAWDMLQAGDFDAVVSDVEMPRMDGFELLARIRGDDRLRALPVMLVTSLDSEGERARGMALGADAYMAKGAFDARTLLEILGKAR